MTITQNHETMKTKIFTLLLVAIINIGTMHALSVNGTCGENLTWSLNTEDSVLIIEGTGEMDNWHFLTYAPWDSYKEYIKTVSLPDGLTSIGEQAFMLCSFTSITIPNTVTHIEESAFNACYSLTSINIPNSVTSIGVRAFISCYSLKSIYIPNSVTSIGEGAFSSNSTSMDIHISDITSWCNIAFGSDVGDYQYGYRLFVNDTEITDLVIPDSFTRIGDYTFSNCKSITSVTIPNSVTSIGEKAFKYCSNLSSITIPNSVTNIGRDALSDCSSLSSIEIPNSVTTIGSMAFYSCTSLTSITIPNSVTNIGSYAFARCSSLTSVSISENVTSMGNGVFDECSNLPVINNLRYADTYLVEAVNKNLSTYTIQEGTRWIAEAFRGCKQLKTIAIPNSVLNINSSFRECTGLTSITVPNSVKSIPSAFRECTGLTKIISLATTPPSCNGISFYQVDKSIPLYVPRESIELYASAQEWEEFENIFAVEDATTYRVEFRDWDNTILKVDSVIHGQAAVAPSNPHRSGYTFIGWDVAFDKITSDLIVVAQYELGEDTNFSIIFINGIDGSDILDNNLVLKVPAAPEISGFTFIGWRPVATIIENNTIEIEAIYEANEPSSTPDAVVNPSNLSQKLIRNGNVYILTGDKTYTITGAEVK